MKCLFCERLRIVDKLTCGGQECIDKKAKRLPYETPAVISEEVFETLALSCAKTPGSMCQFTPPVAS